MTEWRLGAYRKWLTMEEPTHWPNLTYEPVDYQALSYYSAPKTVTKRESLDEVDPDLLATFEKLGIPLAEQKRLMNVAVDAVFDSVSVVTTHKEKLEEVGVIFCSMSEAIRDYPELVQKYLGTVVPQADNFFAALNSAVFSDGSFCYIPKGVRCPMDLSTYFRINQENTGQFERTLVVADERSFVNYLEGCTAPMRDENQLHAAVVELVALEGATINYSTVQNWYAGDSEGRGGIYNFVTKRGVCEGDDAKITWTQVEAGSADHVEVPELHPQGRPLRRRVLLRRAHPGPHAGGHGHEDDPPRARTRARRSSPRASRPASPTTATAASSASARTPKARATTRSATRCSSATSAGRTPSPISR